MLTLNMYMFQILKMIKKKSKDKKPKKNYIGNILLKILN